MHDGRMAVPSRGCLPLERITALVLMPQVAKVVKRYEADEMAEAEAEMQRKLAPLRKRKVAPRHAVILLCC